VTTIRSPQSASLVCSFDVSADALADRPDDTAQSAAKILDQLDRLGLAATWAIAEVSRAAVLPRVLNARSAHEIAVLGQRSWCGPEVCRGHFERELAKRVLRARATARQATTLVFRERASAGHLDLLVKHGINAVRCDCLDSALAERTGPRTMTVQPRGWLGRSQPSLALQARCVRWGLWHFLVGAPFTGRRPRRCLRLIEQAVQLGAMAHFLVDVPRLRAAGAPGARALGMLLERAAALRDAGALAVERFSDVTARLARPVQPGCARSILRRAA